MINLLPPEVKTSYRYARNNVVLRKWILISVIALVGLGLITTYGLLTIQQSSRHYEKDIAASQAIFKKEDFAGTQKRAEEISSSFKLVVKVLGQEILFSELIQKIATTIPRGANLTGLTINQGQKAIDVTANAVDYNTAAQVQVNLADTKNGIFSKADILSINCNSKSDNGDAPSAYPCTVNIRALFSNTDSFLFINKDRKAKP